MQNTNVVLYYSLSLKSYRSSNPSKTQSLEISVSQCAYKTTKLYLRYPDVPYFVLKMYYKHVSADMP